jgi:hypothetical protein
LNVSAYSFLDPGSSFPLPRSFDFAGYIETEREFWALFPETEGKRVNFCQMGLTAQIFVESREDGSELKPEETYFLMPCPDSTLKPIRMRACRRLTLDEFRMSHLTALKLIDKLHNTARVMDEVHLRILGPEILNESGL